MKKEYLEIYTISVNKKIEFNIHTGIFDILEL